MKRLPVSTEVVRSRWQALGSRERNLVAMALGVVGLALLWWVMLAPALRVVRTAPEQHRALDAQREQMLALSAQAKAFQSQPKLGYDEALKALQASVTQQLNGAGQVNVAGERVSVTLKGVRPDALAQWLVQSRSNARALATEMRLTKSAAGWDGTVVLSLPAR
jgi:general secretion pathway protein M